MTLLSLGQDKSLWGMDKNYLPDIRARIDRGALAVFLISTIWFVVHTLIEFRNLTGSDGYGTIDLFVFVAFLFPPVIMNTVYLEAHIEGTVPPSAFYTWMLRAMFVISPGVGILLILSIFDILPQPDDLGPMIGAPRERMRKSSAATFVTNEPCR